MLRPLIQRRLGSRHEDERGVTMALVAVSIVAVISMAVLSIDVGTLYEAKVEAQRSADAGALAAARQISISGITGDPNNATSSWQNACGGPNSAATLTATAVAQQNLIGGSVPSTVTVKYGNNGGSPTANDCTAVGVGFGVNPVVSVYVQQATLPTFFSHVFSLLSGGSSGNSGVSATSYAEVFNSSASAAIAGSMVPVQPRCVKPWIVPNRDPVGATTFVSTADGSITRPGVSQLGAGVIGEAFWMQADCVAGAGNCQPPGNLVNNPPGYNAGNLQYLPALVGATSVAVPSCGTSDSYQQSISGCDQSTVYACGTILGGQADLTFNPRGAGGDTVTAAQCLVNYLNGRDLLKNWVPGVPAAYPFQVLAGAGNPLVTAGSVANNSTISASSSIVTIPIADFTGVVYVAGQNQPQLTIVGFLQAFVNEIMPNGRINVTVMNVSGCSNAAAGNPTVMGTSPVPIRLISAP